MKIINSKALQLLEIMPPLPYPYIIRVYNIDGKEIKVKEYINYGSWKQEPMQ